MGVEPTKAASAAPLNGFEDRAQHQPRATPIGDIYYSDFSRFVKKDE